MWALPMENQAFGTASATANGFTPGSQAVGAAEWAGLPFAFVIIQLDVQTHVVTYTVTGAAPATFAPAIPGAASHPQGATVTVRPVLTTTETMHNGILGTWTFSGWTTTSAGATVTGGTFTMPNNNVVFTGSWTFTPADGGGTLPPDDGGTTLPPGGGTGNQLQYPDLDFTPFSPYHNSFIIGRASGSIYAQDNITRAEVATIFFRLFSDDFRIQMWSQQNPFSDVNGTDWFNNAVSTVANAGVVRGMPDGTFRPNQPITRAEVAAITARFFDEAGQVQGAFTDTAGHWAEDYVNRLAQFGWVQGSGDGTFRPDDLITRAEVAAIVNRMLNRVLDSTDSLLDGRTQWPDMTNMSAWYYLYMQEASHSTEFERLMNGNLNWTEILPHIEWQLLERPDSRPNDVLVSRR